METWRLPASEVANLVRNKKISATAVATQALDRVEEVNGTIRAIAEYRPEDTLAAAEHLDKRIQAGEDIGPLGGVPVTVKVNLDQEGYATTNGVTLQKDLLATRNSPVIDNIFNAGALMLGRTNTPAFSYRWFTSNKLHGTTLNPHDHSLTPGGSSGGASAAVASGMGQIALGTDIAGSIRYPAYACGVHGLRPTSGRVPVHNASSPERPIGGQIMAVTGPLARTVADLRLALEVMSAPSPRDPYWTPAPLQGAPVPRKAAVCFYPDGLNTVPDVVEHLKMAAQHLTEAGWDVHELDALPPLRDTLRTQITLWLGDNYDKQVEIAEREGDEGALTALRGQEEIGRSITLSSFSEALSRRATFMRQWRMFLADYPVVLMPVSAELPFDNDLDLQGRAEYERVWEAQIPQIAIPLMGLPGLSLYTGKIGTRPVGVQIVASHFREDLCLMAGEDIEQRGNRPEVV